MIVNDIHCHFFSKGFLEKLTQSLKRFEGPDRVERVAEFLGWDPPGTPLELAERWVGQMATHSLGRVALIASVPGDEDSVSEAALAHPEKFVGLFMVDPTVPDAEERVARGFDHLGLHGICLFPAMHGYRLEDERVNRVVQIVSQKPDSALFVHCGVLTVGARKALGLPGAFDLRLGNPIELQSVAEAFPTVPIIVPHFGGGLFSEALMVADLCPNICFDTSSSNRWTRYHPGLTLEKVFRQALEVVGPNRLIFGSDSSFFPRGWNRAIWKQQQEVLFHIDRSPEDVENIFRGNFNRLFPLAN